MKRHELIEHLRRNGCVLIREGRRQRATAAGSSGSEELVAHGIENELKKLKADEAEKQVADQLRGLGYSE